MFTYASIINIRFTNFKSCGMLWGEHDRQRGLTIGYHRRNNYVQPPEHSGPGLPGRYSHRPGISGRVLLPGHQREECWSDGISELFNQRLLQRLGRRICRLHLHRRGGLLLGVGAGDVHHQRTLSAHELRPEPENAPGHRPWASAAHELRNYRRAVRHCHCTGRLSFTVL